jgi:histidine triad (HIT) family protein
VSEGVPDTVFGRIARGEIPARIVHEDDHCIAFHDIAPVAPFHVLVIPRKAVPRLVDAGPGDEALLGHLMQVAAQVARKHGHGDAFRLVLNNGAAAGQSVFHVHLHVLAGRSFTWPPG